MPSTNTINEQHAAEAFGRQSGIFDQLYSGNAIVQYKRERVSAHVMNFLPGSAQILELNAGTGQDAQWFATNGHRVHATDISAGMLNILQQKIRTAGLDQLVSTELRSFTDLATLENKGPYDYLFSNFAGLNCTAELDKVLKSFSDLLKPGGVVTLVILPKFCLWELLLLVKGKFRTATRRLFSASGRKARVEGQYFQCWYYNPSFVIKNMPSEFKLLKLEGLCTLVPPSYIEGFAEKHSTWYGRLKKWEERMKTRWPWRSIGDYYIISFRKKVSI